MRQGDRAEMTDELSGCIGEIASQCAREIEEARADFDAETHQILAWYSRLLSEVLWNAREQEAE